MARPRKKKSELKGLCRYGCGNIAPKYDSTKACAECVERNRREGYRDCAYRGCDTRMMERNQKWCEQHKHTTYIARNIQKKALGDWTIEQYMEVHDRQEGCCAVCGRSEDELGRRLGLDHCHTTENARGLLCTSCNAGLGMFQDDQTVLENAIRYLDANSCG